jgi:hypothetical protein
MKEKYGGQEKIQSSNGSGMRISYIGNSTLQTPECNLHLNNVLLVPSTQKNLLSVHRLTNDNPIFIEYHSRYYVSFVDDFSKHVWIYLIRHKSEVFQIFHTFQSLVERTFNRKILAMQTDWGGEYQKLNTFFTRIGISHKVSCPHTHQQNGAVERKHQYIVEVGLSLLAHAHMPLKYWDEAFATAAYLINRTPSHVIGHQTPIQKLTGASLNYSHLRVFRCVCWPNLRPYNTKLAFRSTRCVFLGYSTIHKGYKCLDVANGRVYISRDVVFDESIFPFAELNPNAGAQLKSDILLLHPTLLPIMPLENVVDNPVIDSHNEDLIEYTNSANILEEDSSDFMQDQQVAEDPGTRSHLDSGTDVGAELQGDSLPNPLSTRPTESTSD